MAFLTPEEARNLHIVNMTLHVVGGDEFVPQNRRDVEHEEFFITRIRDIVSDSVYAFTEDSDTKNRLERIARGEDDFLVGAQGIAHQFSQFHVGNSRDGAFFVFELTADSPNKRIYCLIKYDYHEAIEQGDENGGGLLRRIVHAFIADKKAIQKSAVIRVIDGIVELPISTRDRMKAPPELADYFANFLDVSRSLTDAELNTRLIEVLRVTLTECKARLPGQNVANAFRRAQDVLRDQQQINETTIFHAILMAAGNPEGEDVREEIQKIARRRIRANKLEGLEFSPDRNILQKASMRKLRTTEGVTIYYPDQLASVTRAPNEAGGEIITIETTRITEDAVVRTAPI